MRGEHNSVRQEENEMRNSRVLVLGEHGISLSELAERTRRLDFEVTRARTFEDAADLSRRRGLRYGAVLVDPHMPIGNLWESIRELRAESQSPEMTCIAVGPAPESAVCEWLRDSDVTTALWDPVGEHSLRFQLNRALSGYRDDLRRGSVRAPTEWSTRMYIAGRIKPVSVYSLSSQGAFLETERPSVTGAEVGLELPLPDGEISVAGRVVYTNVPGNLKCPLLPVGMAVSFLEPQPRDQNAIHRSISASSDRFVV
jgi:hypothetical protein